jgi:uncharacterized protein
VAAEQTMTARMIGVGALLTAFFAMLTLGALRGCDERDNDPNYQRVKIAGKTYRLEIADTPEKRVKGLSGRTEIPETGGMLFIFPRDQVREQGFVMRDCPIDIDIIFLDPSGRITAMHEMKAEPPRGPGEGQPGEINEAYEMRLKRYSSRFPAQFAIEIKGGSLPKMNLREGEKIDLPLEDLKKRAR